MSDGFFLAPLAGAVAVGDEVTLDGPEGHHASVVRRLRVGEQVTLSSGRGSGVRGPVTSVTRGAVTVRVEQVLVEPVPQTRFVCVQALPKNDRAELAVVAAAADAGKLHDPVVRDRFRRHGQTPTAAA